MHDKNNVLNYFINILYNSNKLNKNFLNNKNFKKNNFKKNIKGGSYDPSYNPNSSEYCPHPVGYSLFSGLFNAIDDSAKMAGKLVDVVGGMISEMENIANIQSDLSQPYSPQEYNAPGASLMNVKH